MSHQTIVRESFADHIDSQPAILVGTSARFNRRMAGASRGIRLRCEAAHVTEMMMHEGQGKQRIISISTTLDATENACAIPSSEKLGCVLRQGRRGRLQTRDRNTVRACRNAPDRRWCRLDYRTALLQAERPLRGILGATCSPPYSLTTNTSLRQPFATSALSSGCSQRSADLFFEISPERDS